MSRKRSRLLILSSVRVVPLSSTQTIWGGGFASLTRHSIATDPLTPVVTTIVSVVELSSTKPSKSETNNASYYPAVETYTFLLFNSHA